MEKFPLPRRRKKPACAFGRDKFFAAIASASLRFISKRKLFWTGICTGNTVSTVNLDRLQTATPNISWPHKMHQFDLNKSLQDLDGQKWPAPTVDSPLFQKCHRLHEVPLRDFTIENLSTTIGQGIGLEYLVPLAIEKLHENPLAKGDCYPGDLLANVLRADAAFWRAHPALHQQLIPITERALSTASADNNICYEIVVESVREAYAKFKRQSRTQA